MMLRNFATKAVAALAIGVFAVACSSDVTGTRFVSGAADAVGDLNGNIDGTTTPGVVNVCVFFPVFAYNGETATFSASAPAGEDVLAGNFAIVPNPPCIEVWNASGATPAAPATVDVTASLVGNTAGYVIDRVATKTGAGDVIFTDGATSGTVSVNAAVGGYVWFKLKPFEEPPGGGAGCTPGYWRQEHHYDSWTLPYTPTTLLSDVFTNPFANGATLTLGQAVKLNGGGLNALTRHAVAALLNAASPDVDYDFTVAEVIAAYNAAVAAGGANIEGTKDTFAFLNEQGCDLN